MSIAEEIVDDGFAIFPGVLAPQEAAKLVGELEQSSLRRSKAGIRHALKHDAVAAIAHDIRLLRLAQDVLGPAAIPFKATLFDKSPQTNWLVVWHQDLALPLQNRADTPGWGPWSLKDDVIYANAPASTLSQILALRVHLDDSTSSNGPLRVFPGTHTRGVLCDDEILKLAPQIVPMECTVPRGGVLAMRPLLLHASSKSQSNESRRVLHIEYAASPHVGPQLELAIN